MPDSTPSSRTDIALAASAAGAVPVSLGAGLVPLFDGNFSWDSTNKVQTLTGQAAGSGGNRWQVQNGSGVSFQSIDSNGASILNYANGTNFAGAYFKRLVCGDGQNADWYESVASFSQTQFPSQPRKDWVIYRGHNCGAGGAPADATKPSSGIGQESCWFQYSGTVPQFETHFAQFTGTNAQVIRPLSCVVLQDGSFSTLLSQTDNLEFQDHTGTQKVSITWPAMSLTDGVYFSHATNNLFWLRQNTNTGGLANLMGLDSSNVLQLGDSGFSANQIQLNNPITYLIMANGGEFRMRDHLGIDHNVWFLDASDNAFHEPVSNHYFVVPSGKYAQSVNASFNYYLYYNDASGLTIGSVGTGDNTDKVCFFGGTPAARQTGGAATAGGSYTSNEQLMLQTAYNTLRTFGLLT